MTHRISWTSALSIALALGACGDRDGGATATAGTTTTGTTGTTEPGTGTATTTTTGPGTTTEATTTTGTTGPDTTTGGMATSSIRVVHLSPDTPAIDVFANDDGTTPVVDGLQPRSADTVVVPAGEHTFAIAVDGSPIDQAVFHVPAQSYQAGKVYTLVALGRQADQGLDVVRLEDELAGIDPTKVRLQVTHAAAAPAFGNVDVWTGPSMDMLALLLDDFPFKATRSADLPPAAVVLAVDIDDDQTPDVVWDVPGAALTAAVGSLVHVFAYSDAEDAPSLQVVLADGPALQLDPNQ